MESTDFTLVALFLRATLTVQVVMVVLILASVWVWAVAFFKTGVFRRARRKIIAFEKVFWSGKAIEDLYEKVERAPRGPAERVFVAGMTEWRRSLHDDGGLIPNVQHRIDRSMDVAIARESERLVRGLNFLATTGATAPFVGLFGTVWGIMRAFQDIAISGNTSLTAVAPGIAEALLATGLGLLAAIPAVVFHNKLSRDADNVIAACERFADEFSTLVSRQID